MRQFYIFFNSAETWNQIVCCYLCIYLFLPVFACCDHKVLICKTISWSRHAKTGKNRYLNKQKSTSNPISSFGLIEENTELSHIHLDVITSFLNPLFYLSSDFFNFRLQFLFSLIWRKLRKVVLFVVSTIGRWNCLKDEIDIA